MVLVKKQVSERVWTYNNRSIKHEKEYKGVSEKDRERVEFVSFWKISQKIILYFISKI
jgi:hypothetical protein